MTDDRARLSAHVLLDAVTAMDDDHPEDPANERAIKLALSRLQDVEGITLLVDDETGSREVDATPVLNASLTMLTLLTQYVAGELGKDPAAVVAVLREHLDTIYGE